MLSATTRVSSTPRMGAHRWTITDGADGASAAAEPLVRRIPVLPRYEDLRVSYTTIYQIAEGVVAVESPLARWVLIARQSWLTWTRKHLTRENIENSRTPRELTVIGGTLRFCALPRNRREASMLTLHLTSGSVVQYNLGLEAQLGAHEGSVVLFEAICPHDRKFAAEHSTEKRQDEVALWAKVAYILGERESESTTLSLYVP